MPSLPALGVDPWGALLLAWLQFTHNADGTHPPRAGIPAVITANYSVVAADFGKVLKVDASSAPITIILPDATTLPANWDVFIKRVNQGANSVTVATVSGQFIDGILTYVLDMYNAGVTPIADPTGLPSHYLVGR